MLREAREEVRAARNLAAERGDLELVQRLNHALSVMDSDRLLTTTQAAEFLGIRSVNTLKILVRLEGLQTTYHGNRLMIPLSELERIQQSPRTRGIRASDRVHEETSDLGAPGGLTSDELAALEEGRPGHLPWEGGSGAIDSYEPA